MGREGLTESARGSERDRETDIQTKQTRKR